jgi:hypothetical protein
LQQKVLEDNYTSSFVFDDLKDVLDKSNTGTYVFCPS